MCLHVFTRYVVMMMFQLLVKNIQTRITSLDLNHKLKVTACGNLPLSKGKLPQAWKGCL